MVWMAIIPMAIGVAATERPLTTVLMSAVPPGRAGVGSAMNDTSRELGGALGVAVLGSVLTTPLRLGPRPGRRRPARAGPDRGHVGPGGRVRVAGDLGTGGDGLADAARGAFLDGFGLAALAAAGLAFVTALAARACCPGRTATGGRATWAAPTSLSPPPSPETQLGSRPAIPSTLSSSGASSGTGTTGPNNPARLSS